MPEDSNNLTAALADLRGEVREGFARMEGRLDLIQAGQNRTAQDVADLEDRVSALEARRIPVGLLAATSGIVSAAVAGFSFLVRF